MASHRNHTSHRGQTNHHAPSPDDDGHDGTAEQDLAASVLSAGGSAAGAEECCCGQSDCAFFLEHLGVERDLDTAARLGQV